MMKKFKSLLLAFLFMGSLTLVSCSDSEDPQPEEDPIVEQPLPENPEISHPIAHPIVDPI